MDNLVREFFANQDLEKFLNHGAIIISRLDGIPLCTYEVSDKGWEENSLSALAAASWQAAENIIKVFGNDNSDEYRFSFDTSSSGFYILKLSSNSDLVISYIYTNEDNPGKAKSQFRSLKDELDDYITNNQTVDAREQFLFDEISDDEVDQLFMGVVG